MRHDSKPRPLPGSNHDHSKRPPTEQERAFQDALRANTLEGGNLTDFLRRMEEANQQLQDNSPSPGDKSGSEDGDGADGTTWLERLWQAGNDDPSGSAGFDQYDDHPASLPPATPDSMLSQDARLTDAGDPFLQAPLANRDGVVEHFDDGAPMTPPQLFGGDQLDSIQPDYEIDDLDMEDLPHPDGH